MVVHVQLGILTSGFVPSQKTHGESSALTSFGAPTHQITVDDFAIPGIVFQIGVPPQRIDILTTISGVQFEEAWKNRLMVEIEGITLAVLGLQDLLLNKQSTGREKDAADIPIIRRLLG